MPERTAVVYYYDGTFSGPLACIYESYYAREMPIDIIDLHTAQMQLFSGKRIYAHHEKSDRVKKGLLKKAGSTDLCISVAGFSHLPSEKSNWHYCVLPGWHLPVEQRQWFCLRIRLWCRWQMR